MKLIVHTIMKLLIFIVGINSALALTEKEAEALYFTAARDGNIDILRTFYQAGIPINQVDVNGYSALIISAYYGHKHLVSYLLDSGANACTKDNRGRTALMGAVFKGEFTIAKKLLTQKCDINAAANGGQTAAMFAVLLDRKDILLELIRNGIDVSTTDNSGNTLANIAQSQGNLDILSSIEDVHLDD